MERTIFLLRLLLCMLLSSVTSFIGKSNSFSGKYRKFVATTSTDVIAEDADTNRRVFFDGQSNSPLEASSRTASFYSAVIPLFVKYKLLESSIHLKRLGSHDNVSDEEIERLYEDIHEWGSDIVTDKIRELKGFYVKAGQTIATRVDIFPKQYIKKLAMTHDALEPIDGQIIKEIVRQELLDGGELSELFSEFDDECLGSASIAQVHKATLLDGRVVAVKVQKPDVEGKFLGDLSNIKNFARMIRDSLYIDYYKIFQEVEKITKLELDFLFEAQATLKVAAAVAHSPRNEPRPAPVVVPMPLMGLVTRRVMVMDYIEGVPVSRMAAEMSKRGVEVGSAESVALGRRLLSSLTDAYGSMILGSGIVHGDPHPGNIFVMESGDVALLDCGQVKMMSNKQRLGLAQMVLLVEKWERVDQAIRCKTKDTIKETDQQTDDSANSHDMDAWAEAGLYGVGAAADIEVEKAALTVVTRELAQAVREAGVVLKEGVGDECAAAVAILLFGRTDTVLPGGFVGEEVSLSSPIVQVAQFPSEYILLGRASVMLRGISKRLGVPWGLSTRWVDDANEAVRSMEAMSRSKAGAKSGMGVQGQAVQSSPSENAHGEPSAINEASVTSRSSSSDNNNSNYSSESIPTEYLPIWAVAKSVVPMHTSTGAYQSSVPSSPKLSVILKGLTQSLRLMGLYFFRQMVEAVPHVGKMMDLMKRLFRGRRVEWMENVVRE